MTWALSLFVIFVAVTSAGRCRRRVPLHRDDGARSRLSSRADHHQPAVLGRTPPDIVLNPAQDGTRGFPNQPAAIRPAPDDALPSSDPNSESADAVLDLTLAPPPPDIVLDPVQNRTRGFHIAHPLPLSNPNSESDAVC